MLGNIFNKSKREDEDFNKRKREDEAGSDERRAKRQKANPNPTTDPSINTDRINHFEDLPDEVVCHILSYLGPSAPVVCSKFNRIINDNSAVRSHKYIDLLQARSSTIGFTPKELENGITRGRYLEQIERLAEAQWNEILYIQQNWRHFEWLERLPKWLPEWFQGKEKVELNAITAKATNLAELDKREQLLNEINERVIRARIDERTTVLSLDNRKLTRFPNTLLNDAKLAPYWRALTSLKLSGNQLTHLPPEIGKLGQLEHLDLSNNQIMQLPLEIGQLTTLINLELSKNRLTRLPPEIGQLGLLEHLSLSNNRLMRLPHEIGTLTALRKLWLENNLLTELPPEIGRLRMLRELLLNDNRLTHMPLKICELINLTMLGLGYNEITELPPEIGNLRLLEQLDLNNNEIMRLPHEIGTLTALTVLWLLGNQLPRDQLAPHDAKLSRGLEGTLATQKPLAAAADSTPPSRPRP